MRVTLDLDDALIAEAKLSARAQGISLSTYVERELRAYLNALDEKLNLEVPVDRSRTKPG